MKTRPRISAALLRSDWICCAALLAISLVTVAAPPIIPRTDPPAGIDNRPPAPQATGTSTVGQTSSMEVLNDTTKLSAGDRVSFRIVEDRQQPISLIVTDSGEMEVPHIGRVAALDKTCKQLAREIKPLLEQEYFKRATVIIGLDQQSGKSRGKVYLTGQVRSPGVLELMPGDPLTVSQAILRANGVGDFAEKRKVRLVRRKDGLPVATAEMLRKAEPKQEGFWKNFGKNLGNVFRKQKEAPNESTDTFIVDLVDILEKGHLERDPVLKVGDLIYVPERLINY